MSETVLDAAHDGKNPATAIWTAETERVLRKADGSSLRGDLQSQRRAGILPYLSVTNRATESHAKLNGWLEFLESKGRGDENLRNRLLNMRDMLSSLQEDFLSAQSKLGIKPGDDNPEDLKAYLEAWGQFKDNFIEYHSEIKSNFCFLD